MLFSLQACHGSDVHQAKELEWATALALAALEVWFKVVEDEWELIAARAFRFLDSRKARSLVDLATKSINTLQRP